MQTVQNKTLYTFTQIAISRAREAARSGRKDEARQWFNFFSNSGIVQVIAQSPQSPMMPLDIPALKADLAKLADEVHPQSHSDNSEAFSTILGRLDCIAFGVNRVLENQERNT